MCTEAAKRKKDVAWLATAVRYCYFNEHNLETAKRRRAAIRNSLEKGARQYCTAGDNVKARVGRGYTLYRNWCMANGAK